MKVTVLQQDIVWQNVDANITNMEQLIMSAPDADLYIFPEMCSTGFGMQVEGIAEPEGGKTLGKMLEWAKLRDAAVVATIMTEQDGRYYNRMYFVTPDGVLGKYDKTHLFEYSGEGRVFTPGEERVVWEWRGLRFRAAICYDISFPVFVHNNDGYDVLLVSANFPESRILTWDTLIRARAIENQCYVVASNRVGDDEYGHYVGHSVVISPFGNTIAECEDNRQGSATAEIDLEFVEKMRRSFPLMQEKREW